MGRNFTANACIQIKYHKIFLECVKDGSCVELATARLVEVYACQMPNGKSGLQYGKELMETGPMDLRGAEKERRKLSRTAGGITLSDACIDG